MKLTFFEVVKNVYEVTCRGKNRYHVEGGATAGIAKESLELQSGTFSPQRFGVVRENIQVRFITFPAMTETTSIHRYIKKQIGGGGEKCNIHFLRSSPLHFLYFEGGDHM